MTITLLALIAVAARTSFLTLEIQLILPVVWSMHMILPSTSATTTTPKPAAVPEANLFVFTSHSVEPLVFSEVTLPLGSLK